MDTSRPNLVCDIDGVVLDFEKHWVGIVEEALGRQLTKQNGEYHFMPRYALSRAEYRLGWEAFQAQDGWATVPLIPGADQVLQALSQRYRLHAVTGIEERHLPARIRNLERFGLPFESVQVTGHRDNSKESLLRPLTAVAFIDDRLSHLQQAQEAGIQKLYWVDRGDAQDIAYFEPVRQIEHIREMGADLLAPFA